MRSIVVGIDFSKGSLVALEIAVDIANQLHTGIKIAWVMKARPLFSNEQVEMASRLAEDKLQQLCDQYQDSLRYGTIEWHSYSGKVASIITQLARDEKSPMIVIGTNGASGFEKYIVGSTAVRIIQEATCPVLTVRQGFNFHKKLEHIVVPIRATSTSRQKVPPAAQMAKIFNSKVHILGLLETAQDEATLKTYLHQTIEYFNNEGIAVTSSIRPFENYASTLLEYAYELDADLLVINTEQNRPLAEMFIGTNAQQIVHKSQIPVLCIHPEDIGSISR